MTVNPSPSVDGVTQMRDAFLLMPAHEKIVRVENKFERDCPFNPKKSRNMPGPLEARSSGGASVRLDPGRLVI